MNAPRRPRLLPGIWQSRPRRVLLLALGTVLALLVASGCGPDEPAVPVDLSKRESVLLDETPVDLTYAYLPQYAHAVSYARHAPLIRYLEQATGLTIRQVFPDTFDEHLQMVALGRVDISFVNPFMMVRMADRLGARPFARVVEPGGRDVFRGQVICRSEDERIRTLGDVRGKRWIAVDPTSAGGYLFPLGMFVRRGIRPADFAEVAFAPCPGGKQERVVMAVYAGKYDIGTIREGTLGLLAGRIDLSRIRVLAETPWYPGWGFAARRGLDPSLALRILDALTTLDPADPDQRVVLDAAGFVGVVRAANADFDPVRRLMAEIGAMPGGRGRR